MPLVGELAALATSLCFSLSSIVFTFSGRELGSILVNRTRLLIAILLVMLLHLLLYGQLLPINAGNERWFWLGLSGFVGLALGDGFLFQAFILIGPRLSMLMMALAPVLGAIMAWIFLGENLSLTAIVGIIVTVGGILIVVAERREDSSANAETKAIPTNRRRYVIGLLCGLGGGLGQAGGLILSKLGLVGGFPALSGNLIRLIVAGVIIWILAIANRQLISSYRDLKAHPRALLFVTGGTILGPVLGVWLSLVAVQNADVGIVSTLSSLMPIFLIPISYFVYGERITRQAVFGTVVAIVGMILLFV
ncbi:MAG: DMT family transporter [Chloroflexota bacterium]|nr:DMT family transporter [Anaerolineae bacterium]